jgi:SARP family transcriptional regulator, regulator of embCAB operon
VGNAEVMDEARVQLCGTFAVELRGRRIDNLLTGRQGRLLFAYLVVSRLLPVSRNSLIDALWSDAPTADASGALNALISKTRAVVGGDVLRGRTELPSRTAMGDGSA